MKKLFVICITLFMSIVAIAQDHAADKSKAYVTSQDFVKEKFKYPKEVEFNRTFFHEKDGYRKCTVLGKLTAKNAFGVKTEYGYKIWLTYNGGEWTDGRNWSYSKLVIEDATTGEQQTFRGNSTASTKPSVKSKNTTIFLGLTCPIVEDNGTCIRIQTPRKLSEAEIKKGLQTFEYKSNRNPIQFCLKGKTKRSEEYAQATGNFVLVFE